ncbi:ty3-gypsy retrotransposon protein, partial [Tanacetum coccineum]
GYAAIAIHLTDLLKSGSFHWNPEATHAFNRLKEAMVSLPVLALPDFTKPFDVETNASGFAIGTVLSQRSHPIAYFSKKLNPSLQSSSTYTREMFAITKATIQTPDQQRWLTKLLGYDYKILYRPSQTKNVADVLSRCPHSEFLSLYGISYVDFQLLDNLRSYYSSTKMGQQLVSKLTSTLSETNFYQFRDGLLYFKGKLFIPEATGL